MRGKIVAAAGAALASGLLLTGCGELAGIAGPSSQEEVSYDVTDEVKTVEVESASGDIVVTGSTRTGIRVTETQHWRGDDEGRRPKTTHEVHDGLLKLASACPGFACSVDYRVEVPSGLAIKADAGSGNITLRALAGKDEIHTGSGDIMLRELAGTAEVHTGSGNIEAESLTAKTFLGRTGSGDITVAFDAAPGDLDLETGSGNGTVKLPKGAYNVTARTDSGDSKIAVGQDDSSPHRVKVHTGSGDLDVLPTTAG